MLAKAAQRGRHFRKHYARCDRDPDQADLALGRACRPPDGSIEFHECDPGTIDHDFARRGERGARAPREQGEADGLLDLGDADAELGLPHAEPLCGAAEVLLAGKRGQNLEITDAQSHSNLRMTLYEIRGFPKERIWLSSSTLDRAGRRR